MTIQQTPLWKEDEISQIPALQLLQNIGYTYLTPTEVTKARLNKESNVLLEEILDSQLRKINKIHFKNDIHDFSDNNIKQGIQSIKDIIFDGLVRTNQKIYDLLTLGKSLEQIVGGDRKSFTLQYFDFKEIKNNVFHVAEEFSVERAGSKETYRPDIVLFVNGIPLGVIECKKPDSKDPIDSALSQMLRNQGEDGIPKLFTYTQLLMVTSRTDSLYATTGTSKKFWAHWLEKEDPTKIVNVLINKPLSTNQKERLFSDRFKYVRDYFDTLEKEGRVATIQDMTIYSLFRPDRLIELFERFTVFDGGEKKIARYQQYFAIKNTINRITHIQGGKRTGGVIWHTQGSGKSLTMVMLAKAIAMEPSIRNPRIVVVTDRVELDKQIKDNFKNCGLDVERAETGKDLAEILIQEKASIVTTIINKFEAVLNRSGYKNPSSEIFVLVDEGHRTQYGVFNTNMLRVFPNGCFIALTGTPLLKKDKSTAVKFGGIIDKYTIDQAVRDKAVVPLLYEGRLVLQDVNQKTIDIWFEKSSENLTPEQKSDLKKKFSTSNQLNKAEQKIKTIAYDVSYHFRDNPNFVGMKGQLTAPSKIAALKYKKYFDECGIVSTEVLISSPDLREGYENTEDDVSGEVQAFWKKMMSRFGKPEAYDEQLRTAFKNSDDPQIIIVVDKLLTGFDAPKNTVLYICRSLKEHTLLQAIARVNRLYEGKEFGYVIDYYGVLGKLDDALDMYSNEALAEFEKEDLIGTFTHIAKEVEKLPQKHSELWDIFKTIKNKLDPEQYEQLLSDEAIRTKFKNALSSFARTLAIALSTVEFMEKAPADKIKMYKNDLGFFEKLRRSVIQRYAEVIDYKEYATKIEKLIDLYVTSDEVIKTTDLVNIFDKEKFEQTVEQIKGDRAKAETIINRTKKTITEKMADDPAFYSKFSKMLQDVIDAYQNQRLSDAEYLKKAGEIMEAVRTRTGDEIPELLKTRDVARAFYGIALGVITDKNSSPNLVSTTAVEIALKIENIIQERVQVDWTIKVDVQNSMKNAIEDFLYKLSDEKGFPLSFQEMDQIIEKSIDVAKHRYNK
ncbi:MAG: HsdR family type I site-specific deoxyribonuclease [Bdellovibrionota bacterium]